MDEMARFLEICFERDLRGAPPVDLDAIREGRPQPAPPEVELDEWTTTPTAATAATDRPSPAARNGIGRSAVFTVRLARDDLALLERRAHIAGMAPSALARNLINRGLRDEAGVELAEAVRRVEDAAAQLRAAVP